MRNLTLHPFWLTFMPAYEHTIGAGTHCLSALAFYLMKTKTPSSGKPFVKYLMMLQVGTSIRVIESVNSASSSQFAITLVDIHYGFLVCPITLFPVQAGLCKGILVTWFGLSCHAGHSAMFMAMALVGLSVVFCIHYKYSTIAQMVGQTSLLARRPTSFRIALLSLFSMTWAIDAFRSPERGHNSIQTNYPSLSYLFDDPKYYTIVYDPERNGTYDSLLEIMTIFDMLFATILVIYLVSKSFSLLSNQSSLSDRTSQLQHQLIRLLLIQTIAPLVLQAGPLLIFTYSILTDSLNPDICNAILCLQLTHAFCHTTILIVTTPRYREACMSWRVRTRREKSSVAIVRHQ